MLLLLLICWIFYKELTFQFKNCYKCVCSNIYTKAWKQLKTKGIHLKQLKAKGTYTEGEIITWLKRETKILNYLLW